MAELKFLFRRTLINGCREEVYLIHGSASPTQIKKLGPRVGAVDEKTQLRVVSRHVAECKLGRTHRPRIAPPKKQDKALAAFAGVVSLPSTRHRPDRRRKALRLKVWFEPVSRPEKSMPWNKRPDIKKITEEEFKRELRELRREDER